MDCWMEGGFQIIAQPFFLFPAIQPLFLKQKKKKKMGFFGWKYSIVYISTLFFLWGNLCLNVLCMGPGPPSIIPLKNIKETICFPPNLTLAQQTDRSESSNIHKDRQTPTRLYLNSLILFFYLLPHQLSLFAGWFFPSFFSILLSSTWTLPCTVVRELNKTRFRVSSRFARNLN